MKSQERQQFWQQHVDAWQASSLSGAAFCKQHALNYAQFNYWRRKFQSVEAVVKPAGFTQVTQLAAPPSGFNEGLGIHLPSGISFSGVTASNLDVVLVMLRQL